MRLSWRAQQLLIRRGLYNKDKLRTVKESRGLQSIRGVGANIEKELLNWLDSREEDSGRTPESELESFEVYIPPEQRMKELEKKVRELNLKLDELREQLNEQIESNITMEMFLDENCLTGKYRIWRSKL